MLLEHAWLAPLDKPSTIIEEDSALSSRTPTPPQDLLLKPEGGEDKKLDAVAPSTEPSPRVPALSLPTKVFDQEVADWVVAAVERRRTGKMGKSAPPPLHAAPLDAVTSPTVERRL